MPRLADDVARRLEGRVIPAVPVPHDARGRLRRDQQAAYVRWMSTQPVGAVAVWAHTGRGLLLDEDRRGEVLAAWRAGAAPIVCGVGCPAGERLPTSAAARTHTVIGATVRLAGEARAGGAAAVMVHPPAALRDLPDLPERTLDLHRAVADAGLPVIAFFLYEAAGGVPYAAGTVRELLALDRVIGIKVATLDSVVTFQDLAGEVPAGRLLITGEDRFLGYSLMLGARSALIGMAAACTDVCVALLDAWCGGDAAAFVARSARVDAFGRATFGSPVEGYVQRMLWALEADGVLEPGNVDPHAPALPPGERDRVAAAVRALRAP